MIILDAVVVMLALAFAALVEIVRSDQPELLGISVRVPVQGQGRQT